jgi:hypothetical protein
MDFRVVGIAVGTAPISLTQTPKTSQKKIISDDVSAPRPAPSAVPDGSGAGHFSPHHRSSVVIVIVHDNDLACIVTKMSRR